MATAEQVLDTFKELLWDSFVSAGLQKVIASSAFLSWGPIAAFLTYWVTKFTDELYAAFKMFVVVELLVLRNKELLKEYGIASAKLKQVALSSGIESPEFKVARDEDKKRLEPLVRYSFVRDAA